MPKQISNQFDNSQISIHQHARFDICLHSLNLDRRTFKEQAFLLFIIRSFIPESERHPLKRKRIPYIKDAPRDHPQWKGMSRNFRLKKRYYPATYEDAYHNQIVTFKSDDVNHIESNRGRIKVMIDQFIKDKIIKRLSRDKYLINPKHARNMKGSQATLMNQIIDNEF